jgi:hypothetical protein
MVIFSLTASEVLILSYTGATAELCEHRERVEEPEKEPFE